MKEDEAYNVHITIVVSINTIEITPEENETGLPVMDLRFGCLFETRCSQRQCKGGSSRTLVWIVLSGSSANVTLAAAGKKEQNSNKQVQLHHDH